MLWYIKEFQEISLLGDRNEEMCELTEQLDFQTGFLKEISDLSLVRLL